MNGCFYEVDSLQGAWNSGRAIEGGNLGHRPGIKGGYFPVPPVDTYQDLRTAMCLAMEEMGLKVEVHHAEVATGGQAEINVSANTLVRKADEVQILSTRSTTWRRATARRPPSCRSRSSATTATACTSTSRSQGRQEHLRRRQVRRYLRDRHLLHRRHHQARQGAECDLQREHQQLQAPGAGVRGAGDARVLRPQPLGVDPHPARDQPEGPPH